MNKTLLCLPAVICFSLLNVATADSITECRKLLDSSQYREPLAFCQEACNMNKGTGCNNLGWLYDNGLGVRQNFRTAKEYYGKACDSGDQQGCDNYRKLNEKGY